MEFVMSNILNFPIKYEYPKVTPGDYVLNIVSDLSYMYSHSQNKVIKVLIDTSNATNMYYMFFDCDYLIFIPQLDTSKVTNMSCMFMNCGSLLSIPQLDTSNVTTMEYTFSNCESLTSIPQLDTGKVTNMSNMFNDCTKLKSIPLLNCQNVTSMFSVFGYSNINSITDLGGFKDLGKKSVSGISSGFLDRAPNLTHESLMNVINNLYDRKSNGLSTISISLGTTNLDKLTDEEKAIAINKGWNLS